MLSVDELLDAGYDFGQRLEYEYYYVDEEDLKASLLDKRILIETMEESLNDRFWANELDYIITVIFPDIDGHDGTYNIDVNSEKFKEFLNKSETVEDFGRLLTNL